MKKLPTKVAEQVYRILEKFADAHSAYYERETFIFHYGVIANTSISYKLSCIDGSPRTFFCKDDGDMWLEGKGSSRVNSILRKITKEINSEFELGDFNVVKK
jgi:hypothetical protein